MYLLFFYKNNEWAVLSLKLNSLSQKRKSEDLNGDSTNGQNEDKKEDDNVEEVGCFVGSC